MARLPQADRAILDTRKLVDYCLNPEHPRGRHKARVFRETLGIMRADAQRLRETLLTGIVNLEGEPLESDPYGRRWRVDVPVAISDRNAIVRTLWIIRAGETIPRFVTCWVM